LNETTIVAFRKIHVPQAVELLSAYYANEQRANPVLPPWQDYFVLITKQLSVLAEKGQGFVILERDVPIGYLAGYAVDALFGKAKGIYIPIYGHAADHSRRTEIEQVLYERAAEAWVGQDVFSHAISVFAHDTPLMDMWHQLGFGNRCVDAIRAIRPKHSANPEFRIERITSQNAALVEAIHREHNRYYRSSPMFMPTQEEDAMQDLLDWLSHDDRMMFCLQYDGVTAGYVRYQAMGESVFSIHPSMRNITGLYVLPQYRNRGIGERLLHHVESILDQHGFGILGVDYESINPKGNRFWQTHFVPHTYTLVRRIDERINGFQHGEM